MESKDDNPSLVDLLYDDELEEEQADQLRAEIEGDPDEREELEAYESMLGRIRAAESGPEVSGDLHDAIVDQAREHAGRAGAGADAGDSEPGADPKPDRRPPSDPSGSGTGIWGRLTDGNALSQMTIAAMALLAGGTVLYMLRARPVDKTGSPAEAPASTSESEVALDEPPAESSSAPEQKKAEGESAPIAEQEVPEAEETEPTPNEAPSSATKDKAPAVAETGEAPPAPKKKRQPRAESNREVRARANSGPADAPPLKNDSDTKSLDLFDDSQKQAPSPEGTTVFGAQKGADSDQESPTGSAADSKTAQQQKPAGDNESVGRLAMGGERQDSAAGLKEKREADRSASTDSAEPESKPTRPPAPSAGRGKAVDSLDTDRKLAKQEKAASSDDSPQGPSPRDIEEAYRRDAYTEAVTLADKYLASDDVSELQKARVLELKARALEELGRTAEAHTVYTTLRRNHDSYKSDEIDRARRRTDAERSKKTGDSAPRPTDEAASEQPQMMVE